MLFSGLLDIAISMIFLYLLISLICTAINEIVATLLSLRSRSLSVSVAKILEDEQLVQRFYANGLVKAAISASQRGKTPAEGVPLPKEHSSYLDSKTFAMALLGSLDPNKPIPGVADIEQSLNNASLPSGVRDILASALTTGKSDMTALRNELASWFDTAMDRLSGEYKRQIRWISFGVGLVLAVLLNVDSFDVAKSLWKDQGLRQQLAGAAETYLQQNPASCPVPTSVATPDASAPAQPDTVAQEVASGLNCQLGKMNDALDQARPFPIGWNTDPVSAGHKASASRHLSAVFSGPGHFFAKVFGWLFTAVALSLGAPFWFDTLSKFMNIRGAGKKPEEAPKT